MKSLFDTDAAGKEALSRRQLVGLALSGATTLVVTQVLSACGAASAATAAGNDVTPASGTTSCTLTASLTEGPYFVDERLLRADIRTDPATGAVSPGAPLSLTFNVSRISGSSCTPLTGAYLDVWHCDAAGAYSDVSGGGAGRKFLRGYQITDATGKAAFTTIYPGWYSGRAVHIHFKLRLFAGATKTYEFTSQFFMDETVTDVVHAASPYNTRGVRNVRNSNDGIYNALSTNDKGALTLQTTSSAGAYAGIINLGVQVA